MKREGVWLKVPCSARFVSNLVKYKYFQNTSSLIFQFLLACNFQHLLLRQCMLGNFFIPFVILIEGSILKSRPLFVVISFNLQWTESLSRATEYVVHFELLTRDATCNITSVVNLLLLPNQAWNYFDLIKWK